MRVLHSSYDRQHAAAFDLLLRSRGFQTELSGDGEEVVELAKLYDYDALLLDTDLPGMSGLDAVRQIRAAGVRTPVVILSGDADVPTKVAMLTAGADDYIVKPCDREELAARLTAVIRRSHGHAQAELKIGPIAVNLEGKSATVDGRPLHLTGKEFAILELLATRRDKPVTKDNLLNHLYGGRDEPEVKIIDVFVCKLRKKLMIAGAPGHIRTVWGRGYTMTEKPGVNDTVKHGTLDSIAGRVLSVMADGKQRASAKVAEDMGEPDLNSVRSAMGTQVETGWLSHDKTNRGRALYQITAAGLAEYQRRKANQELIAA